MLLAGMVATAASALAQPARVAAIGDSLTDEYAEQTYGAYARSWTEILVSTGRIDMGPRAAGVAPLNYWDEPRRSGFQNNWARYAETTEYAIASGQHTGAAGSVAGGRSEYVAIFIGGNDYAPWIYGTYNEIYYNRWNETQIQQFHESRLANFRVILGVVQASGGKVVLASIPDFSFMPWVWQVHGALEGRERVGLAMAGMRNRMKALARERRIVFLDLFELMRDVYGADPVARSSLLVGNVPIRLQLGSQSPNYGFVEDIAHPHTVIQGILARAWVTAFNGGFNAGIPEFSEAEINGAAGLGYLAPDSLPLVLKPMRAYVQNFACIADFNLDHHVGVQDVLDYLNTFFTGGAKADLNANGQTEVGDLFEFLTAYFAPCV